MYDPGVESSDTYVDKFTSGLLHPEYQREVSNFICANYVDGDDIILIGFTRGTFTARSVVDMIATVGLLRPSGPGYFCAVFEDDESMTDVNRDLTLFLDPQALPYDSEEGKAKRE
ncbi:peptidoglycan binding domain-containing protein [Colletotrichum asianum]